MSSYNNEKWDRRFLNVAKEVSSWSKDPSSKIGAVIVDQLGRIVGTGFNGFPRGVYDSVERYIDRELKYKMVLHAEHNACLQAGDRARGATIYVYPGWGSPCLCDGCAKVAIQCGIVRSVGLLRKIDADKVARWKESLDLAQQMCDEAFLVTTVYEELNDVEPATNPYLISINKPRHSPTVSGTSTAAISAP